MLIPKVKSIIKSFKLNIANIKLNNYISLESNIFENLKSKFSHNEFINLENLKTSFICSNSNLKSSTYLNAILQSLLGSNIVKSLIYDYPSVLRFILRKNIRKSDNFFIDIDGIFIYLKEKYEKFGIKFGVNEVKIINPGKMKEIKFKIDKQFKRGERQKTKLERKKWNKIKMKKFKKKNYK